MKIIRISKKVDQKKGDVDGIEIVKHLLSEINDAENQQKKLPNLFMTWAFFTTCCLYKKKKMFGLSPVV